MIKSGMVCILNLTKLKGFVMLMETAASIADKTVFISGRLPFWSIEMFNEP